MLLRSKPALALCAIAIVATPTLASSDVRGAIAQPETQDNDDARDDATAAAAANPFVTDDRFYARGKVCSYRSYTDAANGQPVGAVPVNVRQEYRLLDNDRVCEIKLFNKTTDELQRTVYYVEGEDEEYCLCRETAVALLPLPGPAVGAIDKIIAATAIGGGAAVVVGSVVGMGVDAATQGEREPVPVSR